jgi:hypothetical protein
MVIILMENVSNNLNQLVKISFNLHDAAEKQLKDSRSVYSSLDIHNIMNDMGNELEFGVLNKNITANKSVWQSAKDFVEYCSAVDDMLMNGNAATVYFAAIRVKEIENKMAELSDVLKNATEVTKDIIRYVGNYYLATDGVANYFVFRNFGEMQWNYIKVSPQRNIKLIVGDKCYSNYGGTYIDKIELTYA